MSFIKRNRDWIISVAFALIIFAYPTIKFASNTIEYVNNYGDDSRKTIMFLWHYMLLVSGGSDYLYQVFWFVLLLPIPLVLLASYRFQNSIRKNNLIQEEFNLDNNRKILNELLQAYKRVLLYIMITSILFLLIAIVIPNSGFTESGSNDIGEAVKMNIGFILFSLITTNISIIVVRFTKKYQYTIFLSLIGFLISTLLIALLFEGIGNALGIELLNMDITFYSLIWTRNGPGYLIDLLYGIISFFITGYIIYLLYIGDKSIIE